MLFTIPLVAALMAPLAIAVPTPGNGNTWGTGGGPPAGYSTVENFCSTPEFLACCNGTTVVGAAAEPDSTQTGCTHAMAGGQVTYQFGYCPNDFRPYCCAATVTNGVDTGCGFPTQVYEPSSH